MFLNKIIAHIRGIYNSSPLKFWIFVAIIVVGVFFRAYHFHDWLHFELDQARDAILIENIVNGDGKIPLLGPDMTKSSDSKSALFHVGPAYYYFQIISTKIFGSSAETKAFPDLFFSIGTIFLLYFFLRRYFNQNVSLALTFLNAISFFSIQYARFAWNPNSIPFFVILFLISLHEFLIKGKAVHWVWSIFLGIAIGIGVQLHVIVLILFMLLSFLVSIFLLKKDIFIWKKIALVLGVVIFLNLPWIVSEFQNNFSNSKVLIDSVFNDGTGANHKNPLIGLLNNVDCTTEANFYMLTSFGKDSCSLSLVKLFDAKRVDKQVEFHGMLIFSIWLILAMILSLGGIFFMFKSLMSEKNKNKKIFLALILAYGAISFLLMLPVLNMELFEFRYFIHVFFFPIIFIGLWVSFFQEKFKKNAKIIILIIFSIITFLNLHSISIETKKFINKRANDAHAVVLGETEKMEKFLMQGIADRKNIYLSGDMLYVTNFYRPFLYMTMKKNVNMDRVKNFDNIVKGESLFYITKNSGRICDKIISERLVEQCKDFGNVRVYKLIN
jgi:hypothetical protein